MEIFRRLTRDEEARRGDILKINRGRGCGGNGYLGDRKERKRDREIAASYDSELTIPFAFGPRYAGSPPRSRG